MSRFHKRFQAGGVRKLPLCIMTAIGLVSGRLAAADPIVVGFEGLSPFLSPGSLIPEIAVSPEGGILDEAGVALVTGLSFPPGTVATSPTNVLGNLFGAVLTITFTTPATEVSAEVVGSLFDGSFGTITMEAFDGASSVGSAASDPGLIGDSGAPEALLEIGPVDKITTVVFSSDIGFAATFVLDDLSFVPVPEPSTCTLVISGIIALAVARRRRCDG